MSIILYVSILFGNAYLNEIQERGKQYHLECLNATEIRITPHLCEFHLGILISNHGAPV